MSNQNSMEINQTTFLPLVIGITGHRNIRREDKPILSSKIHALQADSATLKSYSYFSNSRQYRSTILEESFMPAIAQSPNPSILNEINSGLPNICGR